MMLGPTSEHCDAEGGKVASLSQDLKLACQFRALEQIVCARARCLLSLVPLAPAACDCVERRSALCMLPMFLKCSEGPDRHGLSAPMTVALYLYLQSTTRTHVA
jgi:hypothetical protein